MPESQLQLRAAEADIKAIVTTSDLTEAANRIASDLSHDVAVINADQCAATDTNPGLDIAPGALAYVLFISGSTGTPKGVMQIHRSVLHHAETYANSIALRSDDRVVQFANYSFDASIMDIFGLGPWQHFDKGVIVVTSPFGQLGILISGHGKKKAPIFEK